MGNCSKKPLEPAATEGVVPKDGVDVGKGKINGAAKPGVGGSSNGAAKEGEKKQFSWEKKKAINKADYMIMDKKNEVGNGNANGKIDFMIIYKKG